MAWNCCLGRWVYKLTATSGTTQLRRSARAVADPKWCVESETQMKRSVRWMEKKRRDKYQRISLGGTGGLD